MLNVFSIIRVAELLCVLSPIVNGSGGVEPVPVCKPTTFSISQFPAPSTQTLAYPVWSVLLSNTVTMCHCPSSAGIIPLKTSPSAINVPASLTINRISPD